MLAAIIMSAPAGRRDGGTLTIRKDRKTTGLGKRIEGSVTQKPVILVDDILNSGTSAERAVTALESEGVRVSDLFVLIDYGSKSGNAWRQHRNIRVHSLFKLADFDLVLRSEDKPVPGFAKAWSTAVPGGFPFHLVPKSAPVFRSGRVFRGCDAGLMHAFDATTGNKLWEHRALGTSPSKGIWSTPAVHGGRLIYGAYNGVIYCLDAGTGEEIWTQPCCDWIGSSPLILPQHGLAYIGLEFARPWAQGALAAVNLQTGAKVWEQVVTRFQHGSAAYFEGGDLVIWGSADHQMLAMEPRTGKLVWSFETRRSVKYAAAVCEERGWVAFASFDKSIYLLDARTGRALGEWKTDDICYTTPLFAGDRLFCGSGDKHLYVIDLNEFRLITRIDLGSRVYATPVLVNSRIYVGTNGGSLVELDPESLALTRMAQLPDAITNAVAVSDDKRTVFVSTCMNDLAALKLDRAG